MRKSLWVLPEGSRFFNINMVRYGQKMEFDFVSEQANCYPNGLWILRLIDDTMCTTGGAV